MHPVGGVYPSHFYNMFVYTQCVPPPTIEDKQTRLKNLRIKIVFIITSLKHPF